MRTIVENSEATRRLSKRASEMRPYGLRYKPRTVIKGNVLADFIADFTLETTEHAEQLEGWILNVDGTSNIKGQASGLSSSLLKDPSSNNPSPSAFLHPTMKPSMRLS